MLIDGLTQRLRACTYSRRVRTIHGRLPGLITYYWLGQPSTRTVLFSDVILGTRSMYPRLRSKTRCGQQQ